MYNNETIEREDEESSEIVANSFDFKSLIHAEVSASD